MSTEALLEVIKNTTGKTEESAERMEILARKMLRKRGVYVI